MSSTKFAAVLPQTMQAGDKVRIKATIIDNAQEFSINFANDTSGNPNDITYHFKWDLSSESIVENYKENGEWMEHRETPYNALDGRFSNSLESLDKSNNLTNSFNSINGYDGAKNLNLYSILGPTFALEFAFQDEGVYVYLMHDEGRNFITYYQPEFIMSDIESIQVWGDVEKVNELAFCYN